MKNKALLLFAAGALTCGMLVAVGYAQNPGQADSTAARMAQQSQSQPSMAAALEHLRNADQQLQNAAENKGGHRVRAMQLVEQAMSQVEQGIQYANGPGARNRAAASTPAPPSEVAADQNAARLAQEYQSREPKLSAALNELAQANAELERSATNKGGHREQAMQLISQATSEIQQGVQYAQSPSGAMRHSAAQPAPTPGTNSSRVRITNGPMIEHADQRSATIAWSTDHEGSSVIDYGTDPNNLNQMAESPWGANGMTHRVELKNLKPGTRYYFEVETGQAKGTHGAEVESNRFAFTTPRPGQRPIVNQHPEGARF
jgi:hypothetical protein